LSLRRIIEEITVDSRRYNVTYHSVVIQYELSVSARTCDDSINVFRKPSFEPFSDLERQMEDHAPLIDLTAFIIETEDLVAGPDYGLSRTAMRSGEIRRIIMCVHQIAVCKILVEKSSQCECLLKGQPDCRRCAHDSSTHECMSRKDVVQVLSERRKIVQFHR